MKKRVPLVAAALMALVGLLVVIERGGLIGWGTLVVGLVLLAKFVYRPAGSDVFVSLALVVLPVLFWFGTHSYVISTWESGEVVELAFDVGGEVHRARLWVMDIDDEAVLYYDADPIPANALLAGVSAQFTRAGETTTVRPLARRVETFSVEESENFENVMMEKYGARNNAAIVYYLLLGRARDRVAVAVRVPG